MTARLVKFPAPTRTTPQNAVTYPTRTTVHLPEMTLQVHHGDGSYDALAPSAEDAAGAPQMYAHGADVVFDLGDCTPMHTLITLDPDTAMVWAAGLIHAAEQARKAQDNEGETGRDGST